MKELCIALAVLVLSGCISEAAREEQSERRMQRTLAALNKAEDADSLAVAATLVGMSHDDDQQRLSLLKRAAAIAPARPDLLWLEMDFCSRIATCDLAPLAESLHALDPENGAAWAPLFNQATNRNESNAAERYFDSIARSKRFDIYWNSSIARFATAVIDTNMMNPQSALTTVIGMEAAHAIPAYKNLSDACKSPELEASGRIDTCRRIAGVLRNGDTYITEMVGVAIAKRVWPENSAEYADAVAARRVAQYRMRSAGLIPDLGSRAQTLYYIGRLSMYRRDQDVFLANIKTAGERSEPPDDWTESQPGRKQAR